MSDLKRNAPLRSGPSCTVLTSTLSSSPGRWTGTLTVCQNPHLFHLQTGNKSLEHVNAWACFAICCLPQNVTLCTLAHRFVFVKRLFHRLWRELSHHSEGIFFLFIAEGEEKARICISITFFLHDCKECKYIYIGELTVPVPLTNPVDLTAGNPLNWFIDPLYYKNSPSDLFECYIFLPTFTYEG